jgi:hypothetical protein
LPRSHRGGDHRRLRGGKPVIELFTAVATTLESIANRIWRERRVGSDRRVAVVLGPMARAITLYDRVSLDSADAPGLSVEG